MQVFSSTWATAEAQRKVGANKRMLLTTEGMLLSAAASRELPGWGQRLCGLYARLALESLGRQDERWEFPQSFFFHFGHIH